MESKINSILVQLLMCCLAFAVAYADEDSDIALILKARGEIKIHRAASGEWLEGRRGTRLNSGDVIKTGNDALAAVIFTDDKSLVKIRENSTLSIKGKREKSSIIKRLKFAFGKIWVSVQRQKSRFYLETPSGVAAVKGTKFYCLVDEHGNCTIICDEGLVALINKFGKVLVEKGYTGFSSKNKSPFSRKTDKDQEPDWGDKPDEDNQLEFEFQDNEGNIKTLKINYREK